MSSVIVSLQQVQDLKIGDFLPNVFGEMKEVVEIHYKGFDINGHFFACFYQQFSDSSRMSNTIKEGRELYRA
jgi:hypothetical protein